MYSVAAMIKNIVIEKLTYARKSIACVSSVTGAGVTPLSVVASSISMTPISASSTFRYICSSEVIKRV